MVVATEAKPRRERERDEREVGANGEGEGEALWGRKKMNCAREEEEEAKGKSETEGTRGGKSVWALKKEIETWLLVGTAFVSSCKII